MSFVSRLASSFYLTGNEIDYPADTSYYKKNTVSQLNPLESNWDKLNERKEKKKGRGGTNNKTTP